MGFKSFLKAPFSVLERVKIKRKFLNGLYSFETVGECLCGSRDFELIADSDRYGIPMGINLCACCGFCFQSPRPTESALYEFYKADYRKLYRSSNKIDQGYYQRSLRRGRHVFEFLNRSGVRLKDGIVVEIGCGPGGILRVFQEEGNEVWGCDLDEACVEFTRKKGIPCFLGGVEALGDAGVKTDLIILSHLLEHISNPFDFIDALRGILKEEGRVYVELPGLRNPDLDFFKGIQVAHLYYYDLETLKFVMGKGGFRCIEGNETIQSVFCQSDGIVSVNLFGNFQRNKEVMKSWKRMC